MPEAQQAKDPIAKGPPNAVMTAPSVTAASPPSAPPQRGEVGEADARR